ncbi:hypothetical protein B0E37_06336 [Streptomyces sp. MH192]|nr:hypothetical protein [Streptomyces sp. MH192]MCF0098860.1 hypothetical protein [Streptomyces sp. MH191]
MLPASRAERPAASRLPARPDRTSPLPAVASQGVPVAFTRTGASGSPGSPGSPATSVVDPLSRTVARYRAASSRTAVSRAPSTSSRETLSRAAASPACGVRRVGAVRARTASRSARRSPSASSSTGTSAARTSATGLASSPAPGPTTQACTRPAFAGPRSETSVSGKRARTASPAAPTYRTAPAPPRSAPATASTAAPG